MDRQPDSILAEESIDRQERARRLVGAEPRAVEDVPDEYVDAAELLEKRVQVEPKVGLLGLTVALAADNFHGSQVEGCRPALLVQPTIETDPADLGHGLEQLGRALDERGEPFRADVPLGAFGTVEFDLLKKMPGSKVRTSHSCSLRTRCRALLLAATADIGKRPALGQ